MARPPLFPVWNSGAANRVEPAGGTKITGYALGAKPTSGNENWLHGVSAEWLAYLASDRVLSVHPTAMWTDAFWTRSAQGILSTGLAEAHVPLQLDEGSILKTLNVRVSGNASADLSVQMFALNANATATSDDLLGGTFTITNPGSAWASYAVALAANYTITAGEAVYIRLTTSAASLFVGRVAVGYQPGPA